MNVIDYMTEIWNMLTVFFTTEVIYFPLFLGMLLMVLIFYVIYFVKDILDPSTWGYKF